MVAVLFPDFGKGEQQQRKAEPEFLQSPASFFIPSREEGDLLVPAKPP
jgi:hypothetical protein